jgi:hypothetical protein
LEEDEEAMDEGRRDVANEARLAAFFTPGSPYEIDVARMQELLQWRRVRRATPGAVQHMGQDNSARDEFDPFSLEDVLNHPIHGLTVRLDRLAAAAALRTRLQAPVRAALVGVAVVAWGHPAAAAALSAALAPLVHWVLPAMQLIRNALANCAADPASHSRRSGRGVKEQLPPPAASDVICVSYLLCATGILIARALRVTHNAFEPLGLALTARILMFGARLSRRILVVPNGAGLFVFARGLFCFCARAFLFLCAGLMVLVLAAGPCGTWLPQRACHHPPPFSCHLRSQGRP